MRPHRLQILLLLLLAASRGGAADLPVVLETRVAMALRAGGVETRVELHSFAEEVPSVAFPVVSGAGALRHWSAGTLGAFEMVAPTASAPGAVAFRQRVRGEASLALELWLPLGEGEKEVVLRLPPSPNATWSLSGLPKDAALVGAGATGGAGRFTGRVPDDGLLWLSWTGQARGEEVGYLESSELDVTLEAGTVRFRSRLRGYSPSRGLDITWGRGMVLDPPAKDQPQPPGVRTPRADGVGLRGLPHEWFDQVFEGTLAVESGNLEVVLPEVRGLGPPGAGIVTVYSKVPRRLRLGSSDRADDPWREERLPKARRRFRLVPGSTPQRLRFRVSGDVPAENEGVQVSRIGAVTVPVEDPESPFLLETSVDYRVDRAGSLVLEVPAGMALVGARLDQSDLLKGSPSAPGGRSTSAPAQPSPLEMRFEKPATLSLTFRHLARRGLPFWGPIEFSLPVPKVPAASLTWRGRLPGELVFLGGDGLSPVRHDRAPYPLRWTRDLFTGIAVVLREAGVAVAFGLAGLMALYSYLFLLPPNRGTVYALSALLAATALLYNLVTAASLAPGGRNSGRVETEPGAEAAPFFARVREGARRFTSELFRSEPPPEAAPGMGGVWGGGAPAGAGGPPEVMWPMGQGAPLRRGPMVDVPGVGMGAGARPPAVGAPTGAVFTGSGQLVEEAAAPPPPQDDWSVHRLQGLGRSLDLGIRLQVVQSAGPMVLAALLGALSLLAVAAARLTPGKAAPAALALLAILAVPVDLLFPREGIMASNLLLVGLLAVVAHRALTEGLELWERARIELEQRRLRALARGGSATGRDTGGGAYSGATLQKNECSYEDVYRDDEGITFLMGGGEA